MTKPNDQIKQLDIVSFNALASAFAQLQMLGDKKIVAGVDDDSQAIKEKLIEFLATEMLAHCGEFLACYEITHREYLPLLNSIRAVTTRAGLVSRPGVPSNPATPQNN